MSIQSDKVVTLGDAQVLYDDLADRIVEQKPASETEYYIDENLFENPTTVNSNAASVINNALTAAHTAGKSYCVIPCGEFWLTETVYLVDGVILKGCGMDSTTLKIADDCDIDAIRVSEPISNSGIMDLSIDGNRIQNYSTFANGHHGNAINVWLHYGRIERVRTNWVFKHSLMLNYDTGSGDDGLGFEPEHQNDMGNLNKVLWCDFKDSLLQGVMWGWRTMDSWMCYTNVGSHAANLYLEGGTSRFIGNHFDGDGDNGAGPEYNVYCGDGCTAMVFSGNIFENTQKENIYFRKPSYSNRSRTISITDNIIRTCSKATNNTYANIYISGYDATTKAEQIIISGNQILNPDTNANHGYAGIHLDLCKDVKISGNSYFNVGGDNVKLESTCENVVNDDDLAGLLSALNDTNADIEYTQNAVGVYKNYWNPEDVVANHYHANGAAVESAVHSYIIIPCEAGDVFYFGNGGVSANARFVNTLTASGSNIATINNVASYEIPATSAAKLIAITFSNNYSKPQINKGRLLPYVEYGGSTIANDLEQKVDKDGENQVKRTNLEGVEIGNYFAAFGELDREGYLANATSSGQSLAYSANTSLNCYLVRVKKNTDYNITYGRFLVLLDENQRSLSPALTYVTTFNSGNAELISVTFNPTTYPVETFKICEVGTDTVDAYIYPDWLHPVKPITKTEAMTIPVGVDDNGKLYAAEQTLTPKKYKSLFAVGDISDGESLITDKETALKKGESLTFSCNITSFDKLIIGWSRSDPNTQKRPYCEITNTRIIVNGTNSNGPAASYLTHGLTIAVNLQFRMTVKYDSIDVELISNGERYTGTANVFKSEQGYCFAMSEGSVLTDCRLSWCGSDIDKTVWMFGDSYFGLTNTARWPYYMQEDGYADNALLDAYPGRNTANALLTLNSLIALGKPDYIVWCLGMNDGSDTNASTPTTAWTTGRDAVLSICESYGIIPVFATIPNVPNIRHTGKNAWVKSSGYRYIDFAQAVGASESGLSWYEGMLSTDNVHPTAKGAKALYGQVLSDFPEVTIP